MPRGATPNDEIVRVSGGFSTGYFFFSGQSWSSGGVIGMGIIVSGQSLFYAGLRLLCEVMVGLSWPKNLCIGCYFSHSFFIASFIRTKPSLVLSSILPTNITSIPLKFSPWMNLV